MFNMRARTLLFIKRSGFARLVVLQVGFMPQVSIIVRSALGMVFAAEL